MHETLFHVRFNRAVSRPHKTGVFMKKFLCLLALALITFIFFTGCPDPGTADVWDYTVTFDKNGGTTEANPGTKKVTNPATTVDSLPTEPSRTGFLFNGWNTQGNGSGSSFTADTKVTQNITVYAQWTTTELVNSVWVSTTPANSNTGWLTLTFREKAAGNSYENALEKYVAVASYGQDNTSAVWNYSYDSNTKTSGAFSDGKVAWTGEDAADFKVRSFTINEDGTATASMGNTSTQYHSLTLKKVRDTDLTIVDPVPFTFGALAENLVGSVWAGSTPAATNTGWITITFRAKATGNGSAGTNEASMGTNVAVISYAQDNTTAVWNYSYDSTTRAGTAFTDGLTPAGAAQTWNPGAYTINAAGDEITFSSFMGSSRTFKRYR